MRVVPFASAIAAIAVVALFPSSCGSSPAQPFSDDGGGEAGDDGAYDGGGAFEGSFGDDTGSSNCDAASAHCSADLHSVIDCNGKVLTQCPPDQGCGAGGQCVAACQAAKDNKSTIGCEYWDIDPTTFSQCFAMYIANTWTTDVTITVDFMGQSLNVPAFTVIPSGTGANIKYDPLPSGKLPAGKVAIVFLQSMQSASTGCPMNGANPSGSVNSGTGIFHAFHVQTDRPVVAYDIQPYGGGNSFVTSATLLIPTSAWDDNYVAVAPRPFGNNETNPRSVVVALQDNTDVTISPSAAIVGGNGVAATGKGVPHTYSLNKGEVLQFEQQEELTGSPIQATHPVGVWGTQDCINIDACCCDSAHQQLPPVKALGHEYVGVRYRDRVDNLDESVPWRIVGAVDKTTLSWMPSAPTGAPTSLSQGQVVEFHATDPFVVSSQDADHPFYIAGHMTGGGNYQDRGDPEFVNVIPAQEYMTSYVFFTDPTYPETNLVLVRGKAQDGTYKDVTLDCAGVLSGWQSVGKSDYEYTRTDLVRHNFAPQGKCDNGRHEIHSDAPFGLTVWGWGTHDTDPAFNSGYTSYAYPAGASVQPINTVVVPPNPK